MKLLSLDLEMAQPSRKIIQISAVIINGRTGELVDTIDLYVNPNEPLSQEIIELTGITDNKLQIDGLDTVKEGYLLLKKWAEKHQVFINCLCWGSGTRSDSSTLYEQAEETEPNFMGHRVIDAKTLYQSMRLISNSRVKSGLEKSMKEMGIPWNNKFGLPHNALADAHNTAIFWYFLANLMNVGYEQERGSQKHLEFMKKLRSN